jgi:hypothetical protein
MRLKSAQAELKEKEKSCKNSGKSYDKDKEAWAAIDKEIKRIQVRWGSDIEKALCQKWQSIVWNI